LCCSGEPLYEAIDENIKVKADWASSLAGISRSDAQGGSMTKKLEQQRKLVKHNNL
jgi:hypothetical protein